jgi:flagellar hook-length control protein FliK
MTALPITPPAAARVDAARKGSSPPSGSTGDFAALLNQTSARTAPAEGSKTRPAQSRRDDRDAASGKDDKNAAAVPDPQAAADAAQPAPATPQAPADGKGGDKPASEQPKADGTPAVPVADAAAAVLAAAVGAAVAPATAAPSVAVTPATAAPVATAQVAAATVTAQAGSAVDPNAKSDSHAAATPGGKLQIPAELLAAKGDAKAGQGKDDKNGGEPQRELPPSPTLPPAADVSATPALATSPAVPTATPVTEQAATAPAPAVTAQAQPAATAQTAVPVAGGGVGGIALSRASILQTAERVQELVRIATTRAGTARATLQLRPAELGQVDVHLRTTRDGLVATIAAHDQVGLDALQQAGNELRRSLEDKGVHVHSLDLQLGAGQNGFSNQGDAREASSGRRGNASPHGLGTDDIVAEDELTITHASSAAAGALVDVQA